MSPEGGDKPPAPIEVTEAANKDNQLQFMMDRVASNRYGQNERGLSMSSYRLPDTFLNDSVDASIGGNGHKLVTVWLGGPVSPHGATNINEYAMGSLFDSFSLRLQKDSLVHRLAAGVISELNGISISLTEEDIEGHKSVLTDKEKESRDILVGAIAKERSVEIKNKIIEAQQKNKNKKGSEMFLEEIPEVADLTVEETKALMKFERRVKKIEDDSGLCGGDMGKALEARTSSRIEILKDDILLNSGVLNKDDPDDKKVIVLVKRQLEKAKKTEVRLITRMSAATELLEESIIKKEGAPWLQLIKSMVGAASVFNGNAQWMQNASDLDPIGRMWENQGRMVEMHPSNWAEMAKRWPSFEEGFKGLAAIASGKYALGSNGEIYPTGAYALGYVVNQDGLILKRVEKNEDGTEKKVFYKADEIIDVDMAYKSDSQNREEKDLIVGVTRLKENQIWIPGHGPVVVDITHDVIMKKGKPPVKVHSRYAKDSEGNETETVEWIREDNGKVYKGISNWNGWNSETNVIEVDGKPVKIFSKNILYDGRNTDENVSNFMNGIKQYVTGVEKAQGKDPWDLEVNLGVELARNFFEMSMLSSWHGVPRDSKGKPYYGSYEMQPLKKGKLAPERRILNMRKMSTNPESDEVKFGINIKGWDEGTLFPYHVNDWGKLTLTRLKQMSEIYKGRKHGLYPLMPYLPESLAQPMLSDETIRGLIEGESDCKLEKVFGEMGSVERLKTFWLNIAKGIAVYEFISSTFIGDKDPSKAAEELLTMMMNPKNFEAINKNIDLSLLYVDDWEAARLKVNIVTSALAAVAKEFSNQDFLSVGPQGVSVKGKLGMLLSDIKESDLDAASSEDGLVGALKQLVVSRFVGDKEDVMKILNRITSAFEGKSEICFSMKEFKAIFGENYLDKVWVVREKRRQKVVNRRLKRKP